METETPPVQENKPVKRTWLNKRPWLKRTAIGALAVGTVAGTFYSHGGDLPPIYVNKTGTSGGIAAGLIVKMDKDATFYGAVVSPFTMIDGTLYGANINLFNVGTRGSVNGLEVGLFDIPDERGLSNKTFRGIDIGLINCAKNAYGFRAGICNLGRDGKYVDLGILNLVGQGQGKIESFSLPILFNLRDSKDNQGAQK
ncbi:MAG TPA: hypothetical protein VJK07_01590 [Candidatus Nanoarchaeia archaeon]|nr:hypothetical protein [Candidatus Nanoarchaeia archaeon]